MIHIYFVNWTRQQVVIQSSSEVTSNPYNKFCSSLPQKTTESRQESRVLYCIRVSLTLRHQRCSLNPTRII